MERIIIEQSKDQIKLVNKILMTGIVPLLVYTIIAVPLLIFGEYLFIPYSLLCGAVIIPVIGIAVLFAAVSPKYQNNKMKIGIDFDKKAVNGGNIEINFEEIESVQISETLSYNRNSKLYQIVFWKKGSIFSKVFLSAAIDENEKERITEYLNFSEEIKDKIKYTKGLGRVNKIFFKIMIFIEIVEIMIITFVISAPVIKTGLKPNIEIEKAGVQNNYGYEIINKSINTINDNSYGIKINVFTKNNGESINIVIQKEEEGKNIPIGFMHSKYEFQKGVFYSKIGVLGYKGQFSRIDNMSVYRSEEIEGFITYGIDDKGKKIGEIQIYKEKKYFISIKATGENLTKKDLVDIISVI